MNIYKFGDCRHWL